MSESIICVCVVAGTTLATLFISMVVVINWLGDPVRDAARSQEKWNKLNISWRKLRRVSGARQTFFAIGDLVLAYFRFKGLSIPGRIDNIAIWAGFLTLGGVVSISVLDILAMILEKF